jgi:hypothetical protein
MANDLPPHSRTPEDVQQEITQKRAELDSTLDELGRRLSPHEMKERAVDYAKHTALRAPVVLTATLVVAAAFAQRVRAREERERADRLHALGARLLAARALASEGSSRAGSALSGTVEKMGTLAVSARDTLSDLVGETAARAQQLAGSEPAQCVVKPVQGAVAAVEHSSRQHPLLALGIALAVGALITTLARR